jgi:hypothetical protein
MVGNHRPLLHGCAACAVMSRTELECLLLGVSLMGGLPCSLTVVSNVPHPTQAVPWAKHTEEAHASALLYYGTRRVAQTAHEILQLNA